MRLPVTFCALLCAFSLFAASFEEFAVNPGSVPVSFSYDGRRYQGLGALTQSECRVWATAAGKEGRIIRRLDENVQARLEMSWCREFDETEYPYGPYGAKGAGELPVAGIGAAYLNALEQALGGTENVKLHRIPFLEEDIVDVLWDGSDQNGMFSNWQEPEADKA